MKKLFLLYILSAGFKFLYAQEPADALRYSWYSQGGTARVQAIGGAMGSLGGDITATFTNPAGLGLYKTGDLVFTPGYSFGNTKASYLGRQEQATNNKFTWGTTGFVIGFGGPSNKSTAFSLAFNRTADFNRNIVYRGQNNQSSFSQKFLEEIKNGNIKDPNVVASGYPFGTSLAFNTYWIDTIAGGTANNYQFQTRSPISTGLLQQDSIYSTGGIDEIALGFAMNKNNKLLLGGTLGIPILHYNRSREFLEADATANTSNNFNYALFNETLSTNGTGINLRIGLIYKVQDNLRLGLAIHSPTLYQLTDQYAASLTTDTENYKGVQSQTSDAVSANAAAFKYMLITPYRVIGSASYVMREAEDVSKQKGFLTADLEYVNYKASSFHPDASNNNDQTTIDYLKTLNSALKAAYKGAVNLRVGGELKFTTVMVRAGLAYYTNPYKNIHGENGNMLNLSGGLGYRNKGFFVDLTYVQHLTRDVNFAYRLQNSPYFGANVKSSAGNVLLTVGFKI